jgi:DNA invertase Pin-like site-specific DNA recombinase
MRSLISERTRDALARAKARGVELGNPNVGKMNTEAAASRDAGLLEILHEIGRWLPYREIAQELTDRGIPAPRGGNVWNQVTVMRALKRLSLRG